MTDNFKLIADYIDKLNLNDDQFLHIQVMIRHKDVEWFPKGKNNNARTIYSLNISKSQDLWDHEKLLKTLSNSLNARVYINLTPRSYKDVAKLALVHSTENFTSENYKGLSKSYSYAIGKQKIKEHHLYLIDIDAPEMYLIDEIINYINNDLKPLGDKVVLLVPSKTGMHLLVRKFDKLKFNERYPNIDIKSNNPTILYVA